MLETITIFGKEIGMYGIMAVLGLAVVSFAAYRLINRRVSFYSEDMALLMLFAVLGLFFGAHIMCGITHTADIIKLFSLIGRIPFMEFMAVLFGQYLGGMVFYGGLIGCIIVLLIYTRKKERILRDTIFDTFAVVIPLFHAFGRIGCFLAGCCYGVPSHFGFIVENNVGNPDINGVRRLPVQLIESFCCLLIFIFLLTLYRRRKMEGKLIFVYLLVYPAARFILEFFRGDAVRGFIFGLSTSQFLSLIFIVTASVLLVWKRHKTDKEMEVSDGIH